MNQLGGKCVNVVLSVEDGREMEFVKHPIHVAANYNGRILESDKISPDDRTTFNTELIWEVDKKDLRKMRSSNLPLRVECISTDSQNRRDRIGFVLLSLRSAQIISLKDAKKCPVSFKWYKLIGCQADKKKYHPELYLALTVRDHLLNDHEADSPKDMPLISEEEQILPISDNEFSTSFPLKYLDDGYIQIGDDDDCESFSLNLLVKEVWNLDTLLPEALVFRQNHEKYHMTFKIFGVVIKTKQFYKNLHDTFSLNEKVVVRILSSQETLLEFFNTQSIAISLFNGHELLGDTEVELGTIFFEEQTFRCYFKLPPPNSIVPFGGDDVSPFLEIRSWIKRSTDSRFKLNVDEKAPTKVVKSNLEKETLKRGCGDQMDSCILDKLEITDLTSKSDYCPSNNSSSNVIMTKSVDTVVKHIAQSPRTTKKYDVMGTYVKYVLEVSLQNLEWKLSPKEKIVIFKFLHPRASNYITIFTQLPNEVGETSDLKNIGVKISYVSAIDQAENLLNAWPPKLVLTDEREMPLSEEYEFDTSKFFCGEYKSYRYIANLKTMKTLRPLAKLQITLNLEEGNINETGENADFYLKPPVIDEVLSITELADIECWKKSQRELFESNLKHFLEKETEKLENTWKEKKEDMEQKLESQMQKCRGLHEELQAKVSSIKTEKYLLRRRNHANIFEEIFNENWENYHNADIKDIIDLLSKTQRDNEYLRKLVEDQRDKLQTLEKTLLTKEQTTNLLQELQSLERGFEEAQNAKKYFKEQWKKSCEEIHQLKTEEYKSIQLNLQKSREELSHLSLDTFDHYAETDAVLNGNYSSNTSLTGSRHQLY